MLAFRDKALRNSQYFFLTDWTRRQVLLARHRGLPLGRPARRDVGRDGEHRPRGLPRATRRQIFETAFAMQDAVRSHPELRIMGDPTFCFSFTSDEFDIYHVNDFMRTRGLALQRPAVPERDPHGGHPSADPARRGRGVRRRPRRRGRVRASSTRTRSPKSGAIYGGVEGGMTDEADEFIRAVMADMLDKHQGLPHEPVG